MPCLSLVCQVLIILYIHYFRIAKMTRMAFKVYNFGSRIRKKGFIMMLVFMGATYIKDFVCFRNHCESQNASHKIMQRVLLCHIISLLNDSDFSNNDCDSDSYGDSSSRNAIAPTIDENKDSDCRTYAHVLSFTFAFENANCDTYQLLLYWAHAVIFQMI